MWLRAILIIGIVLVVVFLGSEIRGWRAGTKAVTSKQKALRVASACLMIAIMAMILAGDRWLAPYNPLMTVAYWTACFGMAVGLLVLALLDFRETALAVAEQKKSIFRDLAGRREGTNGE